MLEFFRKYQRFFFLIITVVIVISFSFFGTYSTLGTNQLYEATAFTAIDGSNIPRSDLEEMVVFLSTDSDDKLMFGGAWGPNFFNDGVIKKDFLETGLAEILAANYTSELLPDLESRLEKEKHYTLYAHPQGKFVNVQNAWAYFAPELKDNYDALRSHKDATSSDAFHDRVALFLGEKRFPASTLRQVLRYQEQQYNWLLPDANLERIDLSLFGYHTAEDWFGPRFIRIISQFIINAAKIAEKQGYKVTKDEALAELLHQSRISFEQNKSSPYLGLASSEEYFQEQLRRMGMDQTKAVKVWRQVLLFRRLFHDFGNAVLTDAFGYQKLLDYSQEFIEGDLYQLPKSLQLAKYRDLQKLETYLNAVLKQPSINKGLLDISTAFLTPSEVVKKYPELVQKRYLLEMASVDKKNLQTKVGIKETWNWEVDDQNWDSLKKAFPELGIKKSETREERFAALDGLDSILRAKVDAFARNAIVESHPEWLQAALKEAPTKTLTVGLRQKGGSLPIAGLENREEFKQLLDRAPLAKESADLSKEAKSVQSTLDHYTADQRNYYRMRVLDREPQDEILTFVDASKDGTLDKVLNQNLEAYYKEIRESHPDKFKKADQSWKDFSDVSDAVADLYFTQTLQAIRDDYATNVSKENAQQLTNDTLAAYRLYAFMRQIQSQIMRNPSAAAHLFSEATEENLSKDALPAAPSLKDQWKLEKVSYRFERGSKKDALYIPEAFGLTIQEWSPIHVDPNGAIAFFQLKQKGNAANEKLVAEKMMQAHDLLSSDAQQMLMFEVLKEIKGKNAISLDYMKKKEES